MNACRMAAACLRKHALRMQLGCLKKITPRSRECRKHMAMAGHTAQGAGTCVRGSRLSDLLLYAGVAGRPDQAGEPLPSSVTMQACTCALAPCCRLFAWLPSLCSHCKVGSQLSASGDAVLHQSHTASCTLWRSLCRLSSVRSAAQEPVQTRAGALPQPASQPKLPARLTEQQHSLSSEAYDSAQPAGSSHSPADLKASTCCPKQQICSRRTSPASACTFKPHSSSSVRQQHLAHRVLHAQAQACDVC